MTAYELHSLNLPKLTGRGLNAFTAAVENAAGRRLLLGSLLENGGIPKLRRLTLDEAPTYYPLVRPTGPAEASEGFTPGDPPPSFPFHTAREYARAYRQGALSPVQAAEAVLAGIQASDQGPAPLRAFIAVDPEDVLAQARLSAERIAGGRALSLLDGVPVAVKDEVDMLPYPTTVGTRFLGKTPAAEDSTVAARLRAAGALLVGKTNMHEIGINPDGSNPHHGVARNPYNDQCDTGGSSSGSAAAVAAGLVPIAIGADGGGSIRIPAALCGVVGLKPTFGRVSEWGAAPLCWSVAHLGPLAISVEDAALAYSFFAGPDPRDPNSLVQPLVTLAGWNRPDLHGVRLGVYRRWFEHASPEVVQVCDSLLKQLVQAGGELCEIEIPELDEMRIAHATTILSEMAMAMRSYREQRSQHAASTRISLVLGEAFTALDYLQAQRIRTRALKIFQEVFQKVDVVITPATALAAPSIPDGGMASDWSDLGTVTELMRYIIPGNLAGLPAISFPAGYDSRGLPIGMQAMGRHWEEHLLLRVAYTAEQVVIRRLPSRYVDVLKN